MKTRDENKTSDFSFVAAVVSAFVVIVFMSTCENNNWMGGDIDTASVCRDYTDAYWDSVMIVAVDYITEWRYLSEISIDAYRIKAELEVDSMRDAMFATADSLHEIFSAMKDSHVVIHDNIYIYPDSLKEIDYVGYDSAGNPIIRYR